MKTIRWKNNIGIWLKISLMGNETMVSILDITTAFIYPIAFIFFVVLLVCVERIEEMEDKDVEYNIELVSEKEKE